MTKFLFLALAMAALCYASFESGRYTDFDRYGLPVFPAAETPDAKAFAAFQEHAQKGGTFRVSTSETMDLIWPSYYREGLQKQIFSYGENFIYEMLMTAAPQEASRTLHPSLATAIRVDASTFTYVIELRKDVTFSDGTPMTAADVVWSWEWSLKEVKGPALVPWYDRLFGQTIEVKTLSTYEVQVRFADIPPERQREALWNFLTNLHVVKPNTIPNAQVQVPYTVIGTGAYRVVSAQRERIVIKRRDDYWNKSSPLYNFDQIETTL